jgi:hypothetical protein
MRQAGGLSLSSLTSKAKSVATTAAAVGSVKSGLSAKALAKKAQEQAEAAAAEQAMKSAGLSSTQIAAAGQLTGAAGGLTSTLASAKTFFSETLPEYASATGTWFKDGLTFSPEATTFQCVMAYLPIVITVVGILIWVGMSRGWFTRKDSSKTNAENIGGALNASSANAPKAKEGFIDTPLPVSSATYTLINLQPRTIKQVGFLGPLPEGSFDSTATAQALRGGFRSFIFQIDYLDTRRDLTKYADQNIPTLLYRGDDGSLLSTNSADITEVATTISNMAFRPEVPSYTEPVIIYLHFLRTPSSLRDPEGYLSFLSQVATALNPLAPNHLGMTPHGIFHRQKQESILLSTPLSSFEGQVIVLSNADTSVFRSKKKEISPANDLDYWVNMRVYLNSATDKFGVTQAPPAGVTPSAIIVGLDTLLGLSSEKADAFASQTKTQFVIAMPSQMKNPTDAELDTAINTLGVNVVPIDIFSDSLDVTKKLVDEYSGMTFRPKPVALRNA